MNTATPALATGKQIGFLTRLLNEAAELLDQRYEITGCEWPEAREHVARLRSNADDMTRREISAAIDSAMDNNKMLREELAGTGAVPVPPKQTTDYVETGMYVLGERIFKVLPSRSSDRCYAKELIDGSFTYAPGAMRLLTEEHRMSKEQAAEYGALTGQCACCGKLLTDVVSISEGIGPICKAKYF